MSNYVSCEYLGLMGTDIVLFNLHQDIPGHADGSTVSLGTILQADLLPFKHVLEEALAEVIAIPNFNAVVKGTLIHLCSGGEMPKPLKSMTSCQCDLTYDPKPIAPHYPLEISKPVPEFQTDATPLHCQIWIREWFRRIKGRDPEDDFVQWCCDTLEKGGAILMTNTPT